MASRNRSPKDERLLQSLAYGSTIKHAAAAAGVAERTVYRRLEDPRFVAELNAIKAEFMDRAVRMLSATSIESIKTLISLQGQAVPERVRLGAAKAALSIGMRMREEHEVSRRLEGLEQMLKSLTADAERKSYAAPPSSEFLAAAGEGDSEALDRQVAGAASDSPRSDGDSAVGGVDG
jgi:hypothetical protein